MARPRHPLVKLALLWAVIAFAAPSPAAPAGTLDRLVDDLDRRLGLALKGRSSKTVDLALIVRAGKEVSERLRQVGERLIVGKLAARPLRSHHRLSPSLSAAAARKRASSDGDELLLDVTLRIVDGYLYAGAELVATDRSLWRDTLRPRRGALNHVHAVVRVDAEVRAFLGTLAVGRAALAHRSYPLGRREILALAAGDLDGDGRQELAILRADALVLRRFRRRPASFSPVASLRLSSPPASVRSRRPMGVLLVGEGADGKPELAARSSDFTRGATLAFNGRNLAITGAFAGYTLAWRKREEIVERLQVTDSPGLDYFEAGKLARSPAPKGWQPERLLPQQFYGLKVAAVAAPGGAKEYLAVLHTSGRLQLFDAALTRLVATLDGVGVAFDVADVDDDGALEVIASEAGAPDEDDRLTIYRLKGAGFARVWRGPKLGGRVTALTHGDIDGDGRQEVIGAMITAAGRVSLEVLD